MRPIPKILYLLCFLGLAAAAALALNRAVQPSMSDILLRAVVAASFAGAAGSHCRMCPRWSHFATERSVSKVILITFLPV